MKIIKNIVDLGEWTSPKLALGLGFDEQDLFSILDQVEVVSSVPGEVVVGIDVFFLCHTLLVFFCGVGGAGTGFEVTL